MKHIKIVTTILLFIVCCIGSQPLQAQTPCTPNSISCTVCSCTSALAADCTEEARIIDVYTSSPTCFATVHYRIRKCTTSCYANTCQISIDEVDVLPAQNFCVGCNLSTAAQLKSFLEQAVNQILMHGAFYGPCGNTGAGNQTFNFVVSKPVCWKQLSGSGGSLVGGLYSYKYEPCNRDYCCISSFCVDLHSDGTYYIAEAGPYICPSSPPVNCTSGCSGGMQICQ